MNTCAILLSAAATALIALVAVASAAPTEASSARLAATPTPQDGLPCGELGTIVERPVLDPSRFCPEYILAELPHSSVAAITSIAYAPPCDQLPEPRDWCGALFLVRPDEGTLAWVGGRDPDTGSYPLHTFASGLTVPNGLVWHEDAWYVSGERAIYRLADTNGDNRADAVDVIVNDLPAGPGEWTGSLGIGPDGRLYVSKGASCNACEETDPRRGTILSYRLDGTDEQIVARGLHNAFDFAWHPVSGVLWTADSGREFLGEDVPLEELNRLGRWGEHFGWPYCYATASGLVWDETISGATADFCQETTPPVLTLPAHSRPAGMAFYHGQAFPEFEGDLLLVTSGSWNRRIPSGYALLRLCFDRMGELEICADEHGNPILDDHGDPSPWEVLLPVDPFYPDHGLELLHVQGQSFYPDHPVDVAVSPQGLITVAVMEGRLIQLRPSPR